MSPDAKAKRIVVLVFIALHSVLVLLCFGAAIVQPERSGLAPIFVVRADLPASWAIAWISRSFRGVVSDYLLLDAAGFGILGALWWGGLGWLFSTVLLKWSASHSEPSS